MTSSILVVNSQEVRLADKEGIDIPILDLIKLVGKNLAKEYVRRNFPWKVLFAVGPGNNGNDGLSFAKALYERNFLVRICNLFPEVSNPIRDWFINNLPKDIFVRPEEVQNLANEFVFVDAMFGIGQRPNLPDIVLSFLEMSKKFRKRIAVDVPTGIDCDTGEVFKEVVWDETFCVQAIKVGLCVGQASVLSGRKTAIDCNIRFPQYSYNYFGTDDTGQIVGIYDLKDIVPRRHPLSHKYFYGPVGIIAGSEQMFGAAIFASQGALCSGASFLKVFSLTDKVLLPEGLFVRVSKYSAEDLEPVKISKIKSAVFGPGVDCFEPSVFDLLKSLQIPVVVDAGGLTKSIPVLTRQFILTPHFGEFERMLGGSFKNIFNTLKNFSEDREVNILLKGPTLIFQGDRSFIFEIKNSKLSMGGLGDFMAGLITGFLAQGMDPFQSSLLATLVIAKSGLKSFWNLQSIIQNAKREVAELFLL
ncbi:MAG: NAD(P)H-hydrate dehydratase [Deltaproteobacteria bacterium]|nr:NAD(P)H-hydrate dehydratase [Deltaproteobacteria bacterium]